MQMFTLSVMALIQNFTELATFLHVVTAGGEIWPRVDLKYAYFLCRIFLSEVLKDQHFAEDTPLKKKECEH